VTIDEGGSESSPSYSMDAGNLTSTTRFEPPAQAFMPRKQFFKEPSLYVDSLLFDPGFVGSPQGEKSRYAVGDLSVSRPLTEDHGKSSLSPKPSFRH